MTQTEINKIKRAKKKAAKQEKNFNVSKTQSASELPSQKNVELSLTAGDEQEGWVIAGKKELLKLAVEEEDEAEYYEEEDY